MIKKSDYGIEKTINETIERRCRVYSSEYKYNYDEYDKYRARTGIMIALAVIFFFFGMPLSVVITNKPISMIISFIIAIICIFFAIKHNKKSEKFRLSDRETIIYRLCSIANSISSFIKSDVHTRDIDEAKLLNKTLYTSLSPTTSSFPNLFLHRGFVFDEQVEQLMLLIRKASKTQFKKTLEGKRDDNKLKVLIKSIRKIAFYLGEEEIDRCIHYLKKDLNINITKEKKSLEILKSLAGKELFRWILSIIMVGLFLLIIYLITKNLISTWETSGWDVFMFAAAGVVLVITIKYQVLDRLFTSKIIEKIKLK